MSVIVAVPLVLDKANNSIQCIAENIVRLNILLRFSEFWFHLLPPVNLLRGRLLDPGCG